MIKYNCLCGVLQELCIHECEWLKRFEKEEREKIIEKVK